MVFHLLQGLCVCVCPQVGPQGSPGPSDHPAKLPGSRVKANQKEIFFYAEYTYIEELVATGSCKGCKYRKVYQGLGKGAENRSVCEHHL